MLSNSLGNDETQAQSGYGTQLLYASKVLVLEWPPESRQ